MRLIRNLMSNINVYRMMEVESDYVGHETKINLVGTFQCQVEYANKKQQTPQGIVDKDIVKLYCPLGYGLKTGDMLAIRSGKPTHKIMSISEHLEHVVCEAESWT